VETDENSCQRRGLWIKMAGRCANIFSSTNIWGLKKSRPDGDGGEELTV
jgi:hypothetical protein